MRLDGGLIGTKPYARNLSPSGSSPGLVQRYTANGTATAAIVVAMASLIALRMATSHHRRKRFRGRSPAGTAGAAARNVPGGTRGNRRGNAGRRQQRREHSENPDGAHVALLIKPSRE